MQPGNWLKFGANTFLLLNLWSLIRESKEARCQSTVLCVAEVKDAHLSMRGFRTFKQLENKTWKSITDIKARICAVVAHLYCLEVWFFVKGFHCGASKVFFPYLMGSLLKLSHDAADKKNRNWLSPYFSPSFFSGSHVIITKRRPYLYNTYFLSNRGKKFETPRWLIFH